MNVIHKKKKRHETVEKAGPLSWHYINVLLLCADSKTAISCLRREPLYLITPTRKHQHTHTHTHTRNLLKVKVLTAVLQIVSCNP